MFAHRLPLAQAYADLLADAGTVRGLIGPREVPRLWDRHLLGCALVTDLVGPDARVVDIGSGAGLPGLVMAIRRPDLQVTLLEPLLRRTTFLDEAVSALGLDNVEVVRGRAEDHAAAAGAAYDVATSRAVAPLERLAGWSLPLVRLGGVVLAMKGATAVDEVGAADIVVRRHGGGPAVVQQLGAGWVDPLVTVVSIEKAHPGAAVGRTGKARSRTRRGRSDP